MKNLFTKQNKTKQNKTKQNKTKQNKTILVSVISLIIAATLIIGCKKSTSINSKINAFETDLQSKTNSVALELSFQLFNQIYSNGKGITTFPRAVSNSNFIALNNSKSLQAKLMNEIIEDDILKEMLNEDGEIIVDNNIYKVTPYGTFFTIKENKDSLISLVDDIKVKFPIQKEEDMYNQIDLTSYVVKSNKDSEYALMKGGVLFIATFSKDTEHKTNNVLSINESAVRTTVRAASPNSADISDPIFSNLREVGIGNPTGSFFHTLFHNDTEYHNFDKNYRTSVLLYNRNYGVVKSIGLKVKQQKKGWLWWNKTNAEQIVAGWSNVVFTGVNKIPSINDLLASNAKASRPKLVGVKSKGLFQVLIPYDVTIGNATIVEGEYKFSEKDIKSVALAGWNKLKNALSPARLPYGSKVDVYLLNTGKLEKFTLEQLEQAPKGLMYGKPNIKVGESGEVTYSLAPYIQREYNKEMINVNFDWETIKITLSLDPSNFAISSLSNWLNSIEKTDASQILESYKFKSANVFGTTLRSGTWRGIRIHS